MVKSNVIKLENLESLISIGFKELLNSDILGIHDTRVFVNKYGRIITVKDKDSNGEYIGYIRDVSPVRKKEGQLEYKVYIDFRAHSIHKIVALTYPELCGEYSSGMQVHHKDLNHLNNNVTNLVFLTSSVHKFIHKLISINNYDSNIISSINMYIDFCTLIGMDISIEGLEDFLNGK